MLWIRRLLESQAINKQVIVPNHSWLVCVCYKNLDLKITSGLRKILTVNFKKQVATAEGKETEKKSLTGTQIAWMIYDLFKTSGDNEAILDFRDLS